MSGHSKWSTIKRKKGALDAARGKIFTKIIKEITIAARLGGGDEAANPRLRSAILKAKASNMPANNVERAIAKGTGTLEGVTYEEITYEGYGPCGVAIVVETMTDNKNRTVSEVRYTFNKYGGSLGADGAVAWNFERQGLLTIAQGTLSEDDVLMTLMDAGAENLELEDGEWLIYSQIANLETLRKAAEAAGYEVRGSELTMTPKNSTRVEGNDVGKVVRMIEALEELDDVQNVYSNFDADEDALANLE
ncbi:MAG: YebC/PmpR family DNA-binding transcriptional regulator [Calditrichaeota bacterium]|nr:YebC/PmpR family DNA-binding transcriptional regulator [Candidatus Cloacimonadota bacterium]MCB1048079.1 YebC/PmpR family DNA-binding transcriptional regulator [Calditrichota bacterium]MCB9472192.1 YebC/PmpR family DNA-binding transcriptional regulator [Candidatus Delongbacteria bacterium]